MDAAHSSTAFASTRPELTMHARQTGLIWLGSVISLVQGSMTAPTLLVSAVVAAETSSVRSNWA